VPRAGSKRPPAGQQGASSSAAGHKRWRRADSWRPCAIGMLPSPADPNGELPSLDAASQLCLPASFLRLQQQQQQAAEAAAAAAAAQAGGAAGKDRHQELVRAEQAQLAAAAEAAAAGTPWPAVDRFSCAVADASDEGSHVELAAAPPVLLPASPAAFLL